MVIRERFELSSSKIDVLPLKLSNYIIHSGWIWTNKTVSNNWQIIPLDILGYSKPTGLKCMPIFHHAMRVLMVLFWLLVNDENTLAILYRKDTH